MSERIHQAGAEVIALSVDSTERNAAMFQRWPTPHVQYVSDPGGDTYLKPLELFDEADRGGIALPALLVIDAEGREVFGYRGNDFADRRNDEAGIEALEALGLDPVQPVAGGPVIDGVDDRQRGAFTTKSYVPYFMGNKFAALAIRSRATTDEAKQLSQEHADMADGMVAAWAAMQERAAK